jgi:hypothetical protein
VNTLRSTLILLVALPGLALSQSASSRDPVTGITTMSTRNPDGSYTITQVDRAGRTSTRIQPARQPAGASTRDRDTGVTTSSRRNPDGSYTITRTDRRGRSTTQVRPAREPASATTRDPRTGVSTSSRRNADGSFTITETDGRGRSTTRNRPAREPASASCHDPESGRTVSATNLPPDRRRVVVTDRSGWPVEVTIQPRVDLRPFVRLSDPLTGERAVSFGPPGRHSIIQLHPGSAPARDPRGCQQQGGAGQHRGTGLQRRGIAPTLQRAFEMLGGH